MIKINRIIWLSNLYWRYEELIMVDFNGTNDLRDIVTDFIYWKMTGRTNSEEERELMSEQIYSLSEEAIKRLKDEIESNIRIFTGI